MKGVIAAGDQHTAAAGAAILRRGGNAVDAAVAAAFASFIAEIGFVHLGGSGLAQLYDPATGKATVYDFFSNMPGLGRTPPAQLDFHRVTVDFGGATQDFHIGRASVAVPGNIFGLCQLAADRGSLPLAVLLEPALALARNGLPLPPFQAYACSLLEPIFRHSASMRAVFERDGRLIEGGERLFVPELAETLQEITAQGPDSLRHGRLGQALLDDQANRGGLLTPADLAQYDVLRQPPIQLSYRDYAVRLPGPPSGGGALLAFALKLLSRFQPDFPPNSGPPSPAAMRSSGGSPASPAELGTCAPAGPGPGAGHVAGRGCHRRIRGGYPHCFYQAATRQRPTRADRTGQHQSPQCVG